MKSQNGIIFKKGQQVEILASAIKRHNLKSNIGIIEKIYKGDDFLGCHVWLKISYDHDLYHVTPSEIIVTYASPDNKFREPKNYTSKIEVLDVKGKHVASATVDDRGYVNFTSVGENYKIKITDADGTEEHTYEE